MVSCLLEQQTRDRTATALDVRFPGAAKYLGTACGKNAHPCAKYLAGWIPVVLFPIREKPFPSPGWAKANAPAGHFSFPQEVPRRNGCHCPYSYYSSNLTGAKPWAAFPGFHLGAAGRHSTFCKRCLSWKISVSPLAVSQMSVQQICASYLLPT